MWTEITRLKYERDYASDVTDAEWALIEPHMPAAKPLGRPREIELRAVLDAILYIARTGCQWRMLPKDFPPFTLDMAVSYRVSFPRALAFLRFMEYNISWLPLGARYCVAGLAIKAAISS
jgi:hypothetical protein